jgi:hypothetical protein
VQGGGDLGLAHPSLRDREEDLPVLAHRAPAPFRPGVPDWTHETDATGLWPRRYQHR